MNRVLIGKYWLVIAVGVVGVVAGYWLGYDHGFEKAATLAEINSFEDCAAAGYPVMESFPEQCRTIDGRLFIRNIDFIACPQDAKLCPDGSSVVREGPDCSFAPCP